MRNNDTGLYRSLNYIYQNPFDSLNKELVNYRIGDSNFVEVAELLRVERQEQLRSLEG